jgi:hypothetical protein
VGDAGVAADGLCPRLLLDGIRQNADSLEGANHKGPRHQLVLGGGVRANTACRSYDGPVFRDHFLDSLGPVQHDAGLGKKLDAWRIRDDELTVYPLE